MGDFTGWFSESRARGGQIWIKQAEGPRAADQFDKERPGLCELAFSVGTRTRVAEIEQGALRHGFRTLHSPRVYDYAPGYFSAFILDPDGIKLELVARSADS